MTRRAVRRLHGEDGASLIIAMAFLLLFALLLTALLAFSVESFTAGGVVADREKVAYAADAAIDTAVTRIKQDMTMQVGRNSTYAPSQPCNLTYHPSDGTPDTTATCNPQTGSGAVRPGIDGPANAILTRGGALTTTGGPLTTNGNVFVNGTVSGNVNAHDNAVAATGSCGTTTFDAVKTYCSATSGNTPQFNDGVDPAFAVPPPPSVNGAVPIDPPPTCSHGATTFSQGYYTDVDVLNTVASGCSARVFYFPPNADGSPGVYYFNLFGVTTWSITGIVVGGTATSWFNNSQTPPVPAAGATSAVACNPSAQGVQFVLVGTSQIQLATPPQGSTTSLELCPPPSGSLANRVALFAGVPATGVTVNHADFQPCTGAAHAGSFDNPQNSYTTNPNVSPFDGLPATGNKFTPNPAEMDFSNFDCNGQTRVPIGLSLTSVQVVVGYHDTGTTGQGARVHILETLSGLDCTTSTQPGGGGLVDGTPLQPPLVYTCPLNSNTLKTTKTQTGEEFARHLDVQFLVSGNNNTTSQLDGLAVRVVFNTGNVPACSGSCPFLTNAAGAAGHAAIWGTVYAPTGNLNVDFANSQNIVFNMGVIVQSLTASNLPASGDTNGRFRLGDGSGRTVELISNPTSGVRARALVRIVDSQSAPGFLAVMRQWSTALP
jgi:hypothetical protein